MIEEKKQEKYKKPEFVYIGEPYEEEVDEGFEQQRLFAAMHEMHDLRVPITIRILSLLGALFCLAVAAVLAVGAVLWFIPAACSLFRVQWMRGPFDRVFALFKKTLVIGLGLAIGIFSPGLGVGFIMLYFLMNGEQISESILMKMTSHTDPHN